jgi:hypothetical protein
MKVVAALLLAVALNVFAADEQPAEVRASFGVTQCGEVVAVWVVLKDGRVTRTDAEHHPDTVEEYNAFLQWISTAPQDIYVMPCPDAKVGGKAKRKEPS